MSYQDVETQHSLDENPAKDRTRVTRRGVVELAWDARGPGDSGASASPSLLDPDRQLLQLMRLDVGG